MATKLGQLGVKRAFGQLTLKSTSPSPSTGSLLGSLVRFSSTERLIGPAVKNYLSKYGVKSSQIKGTGPHSSVSKGDVLRHVLENKIQPVLQAAGPVGGTSAASAPLSKSKGSAKAKIGKKGSPATFVDVEVTNMRRTIAKRLLQSKSTIPHAYGTAECDAKTMTNFRKKLAAEGIKISVNDIILKCAGNALSRVPAVNCVWEGEKLIHRSAVDISVAVATPNGLITPIVFNVGDKDVIRISETVKILAGKARDGKLQPSEFIGGTFSLSNLGMFGVNSFSAIINPPQCAILAVGGSILSIDESGKSKTTLKLTLSYDGSAIEEEQVAKYMAILKNEIETTTEISMGIYDLRVRKEIMESEAIAAK